MSEANFLDQENEIGEAATPHFFGLQAGPAVRADSTCRLVAGIDLRSGDVCPQCRAGRLDYDGLLNLICPKCGFSPGGGSFS